MRIRTATAAAVLATAVILGSAGSAAAWGGNDDNDGSGHDGNNKSRVSSHLDHDFDWRSIDDSILAKITNDNDSSVSSNYENDETNVVGNVSYNKSGARTGGMYFG